MSEREKASPLPNGRRVITGHNQEGKSIVIRDEVQPDRYLNPNSPNAIYDYYLSGPIPASIDSEITTGNFVDEIVSKPDIVNPTGSVFRSFDYPPGSVTPFHRTTSLDYAIVGKGSMVLELDDGERVSLNEGDVVCQRGTAHAWRNESTEWSRIYFVVLGATPVVVGGNELEASWALPRSATTE